MNTTVIDITNIQTVKALHIYMAWRLELPGYYGRNLDALHDLLGEYGAQMCVVLRGRPVSDEMAAYLPRLERMLDDCVNEGALAACIRE